jgi:hypothetical protein
MQQPNAFVIGHPPLGFGCSLIGVYVALGNGGHMRRTAGNAQHEYGRHE